MEKMDFGALLRRAMDKMVEGEEGERLRYLGYKGARMDLLTQAQIEKAARGDSTAFRLVRDALAEGEEGVDIRQLTDAELRNLLEAEDG